MVCFMLLTVFKPYFMRSFATTKVSLRNMRYKRALVKNYKLQLFL